MATTTVLLLASVCLAYTVTGEFIKILRKPVSIRFQLPSYKNGARDSLSQQLFIYGRGLWYTC